MKHFSNLQVPQDCLKNIRQHNKEIFLFLVEIPFNQASMKSYAKGKVGDNRMSKRIQEKLSLIKQKITIPLARFLTYFCSENICLDCLGVIQVKSCHVLKCFTRFPPTFIIQVYGVNPCVSRNHKRLDETFFIPNGVQKLVNIVDINQLCINQTVSVLIETKYHLNIARVENEVNNKIEALH